LDQAVLVILVEQHRQDIHRVEILHIITKDIRLLGQAELVATSKVIEVQTVVPGFV
jgi:hypothetical protein